MTPVSLATPESQIYLALRRYKAAGAEAGSQVRRLAALLTVFFANHLDCVAPSGVDAVLVVPSLSSRRPPPHPLLTVLSGVGGLPPVADVLCAGPGTVDPQRPGRDAIMCRDPIAGLRILLVDDTYASGAHLQSAAAAVRDAGGGPVHAVVVARFLRSGRPPSDRVLRWAAHHPWDPGTCMHCAAA